MMDRRGFLKMLSAVGASALLPVPAFVLAEPQIVLPAMPITLGKIRVCGMYSVEDDAYMVRLDALNKKLGEQFCVDFRVRMLGERTRDEYLRSLEPAQLHLRAVMMDHKWRADDMVLLPHPAGWQAPKWMDATQWLT
jgi:hypothetical protein